MGQGVVRARIARGIDPLGPGQEEQVCHQKCEEYCAHRLILDQLPALAGRLLQQGPGRGFVGPYRQAVQHQVGKAHTGTSNERLDVR